VEVKEIARFLEKGRIVILQHVAKSRTWNCAAVWVLVLSFSSTVFADPLIHITDIPTYGTTENVAGTVSGVDFAAHVVAPYIYVGTGWWTKPTFASPTLSIDPSDGTWSGDITTGGNDVFATRIAVFLIPAGSTPPRASGESSLPLAIQSLALAQEIVYRGPAARFISFAGYQWRVKHSDFPVGPGPNYFSSDSRDIWADGDGLHFSLALRDEKWLCTEAILQESPGYGTYVFCTRGRLDILMHWIVAGFFTWDDYAPAPYREIDFEYGRWGNPADEDNGQFVIQPHTTAGNLERYRIDLTDSESDLTHVLEWRPNRIRFFVYYGKHTVENPPAGRLAAEWTYRGSDIPQPGTENFRVNYWLSQAPPPGYDTGSSFTLTHFQYYPSQTSADSAWIEYNE